MRDCTRNAAAQLAIALDGIQRGAGFDWACAEKSQKGGRSD
jgi:hypothetical protein